MFISRFSRINILDQLILYSLLIYSLTFLLDLKINFLTTAFILGIIKLFYIRPKITINTKIFYLIGFFILAAFLSILFNTVYDLSIVNINALKSRFISPLLGLALVLLYNFSKWDIIKIFLGFSFSFFINGLAVIYQFFNHGIVNDYSRLTGFNETYMFLCAVNLLILPIIFTLALHPSSIPKKIRYFYLLTILVNIPAVVFENTRIVYVGLGFIFPLIILFSIKNKIKAIILILILSLYAFSCFQLSPTSSERFSNITTTTQSDFSNYQRILVWKASTQMFIDHPLVGIGIGNWHDSYNDEYRSPIPHGDFWHPHNVLLDMLSEAGLLGGIGYLSIFIYLFFISIKDYLHTRSIISLAYLSMLLAYSINCLTDCMFCGHNIKIATTIFYFFTGLYLILSKKITIKFRE